MEPERDPDALVRLLQLAYSGERAAALAYRGHWKSVSDPEDAERIRQIEAEEWHHRELVGGLLRDLGAGTDPWRERRSAVVGRVLGALCRVSGWFLPMYGAGMLERRNIVGYEDAARHAVACGRAQLLECLLSTAEVEWEHEAYFRSRVLSHWWSKFVPVWPAPPPRAAIRQGYAVAAENAP